MPDEINHHIMHKNYLAAAQLVVKAKENFMGPLMNVDALKEVRSELEVKQEVSCTTEIHTKNLIFNVTIFQRLYNILLEDLSQLIYVKSCNDVLQWRHNAANQTPFHRTASGRNSSGRASRNNSQSAIKAKAINLEVVTSNTT